MKHSILIAFVLTLVACASESPRQSQVPSAIGGASFAPDPASPVAVSAAVAAASDAEVIEVETVRIEALDNGRVCEKRKRPGSNITETFCYGRDEWLAQEASREKAKKGQLDELQREARWRDEIIRQAVLEGRQPSGFGLGPN